MLKVEKGEIAMWSTVGRVGLGFDPFAEWEKQYRRSNRFYDYRGETGRTEVRANENEVVVSLVAPGVNPQQWDLTVAGQTLTVQGERKVEETESEQVVHRRERRGGAFSRIIQLPYDVDEQKVVARYTNGMLQVRLPRSEGSKPKKIQIQA